MNLLPSLGPFFFNLVKINFQRWLTLLILGSNVFSKLSFILRMNKKVAYKED
jgi:hypothetical protein